MVEELILEDGLCVMSAGMGWQKAVAVILRLHMERRRSDNLCYTSDNTYMPKHEYKAASALLCSALTFSCCV